MALIFISSYQLSVNLESHELLPKELKHVPKSTHSIYSFFKELVAWTLKTNLYRVLLLIHLPEYSVLASLTNLNKKGCTSN